MTLEVIGAGFGRTGTSSLKVALERLGFAPCDHMGEVFLHPERAALWREAAAAKAAGQAFAWERLYAGYKATTDWPGAYFWRELADAYPAAKVLLSVRDPERWYDSARRTIRAMRGNPEIGQTVAAAIGRRGRPDMAWMPALVDAVVFDGTFGGRFDDKAHALRVFAEHNAAVQAAIPPERLLLFDVEQGWEPLCRFLGVPVPAGEPFPHLNEAATLEALLRGETPPDEFLRRLAAG